MRLHIGNLGTDVTAAQLMEMSVPYGVATTEIVTDRVSGVSRGYGFITFANSKEGAAAKAGLKDTELGGRTLRVE